MRELVDAEPYRKFVKQHHRYLTVADMAYELDLPTMRMISVCVKLGYKPISQLKKVKQYILLMYKKKTQEEIAARLGCTITNVQLNYRKLGIEEPEELRLRREYAELMKLNRRSVREILGSFRTVEAGHQEWTNSLLSLEPRCEHPHSWD